MISDPNEQPDLTLVGDVMPGRKIAEAIARLGQSAAAARLRGLLPGRIAVGNLECALCDTPPEAELKADGAPNLHAPPEAAQFLRRAGFAAMGLANNHVLDCGEKGLVQTIESLQRVGIQTFGAGRDLAEAIRPLVLSCGSRCVAFLAFGNGPPARRKSCGVAPFSSDALEKSLAQAPRAADAVVVMVHVGLEFLEYPESALREFADEALNGGADIVVGSHPHCIRGADRSDRGVILYSLGDFLADTSDGRLLVRHLSRTAMTQLGFEPTGAGTCRQALACDVFVSPPGGVECRLRPVVAGEDLLPRAATQQEHEQIIGRVSRLSEPIRDAGSPEMLRLSAIEKAYARAYGRSAKLKDMLTLPFRFRPRHAAGILNRLTRMVSGSLER